MGNFTDNGDFIVDHAYGDNGYFAELRLEFVFYQLFRFAFCQTAYVDIADDREVYVTFIVYQILLQYRLVCQVAVLFA